MRTTYRRCRERLIVSQSGCQWGGKNIEQRHAHTEPHLNQQPRNTRDFVNHLEQVQGQQNAGKPKTGHGHRAEETAATVIADQGALDANEADQIENLNERTQNTYILVNPF